MCQDSTPRMPLSKLQLGVLNASRKLRYPPFSSSEGYLGAKCTVSTSVIVDRPRTITPFLGDQQMYPSGPGNADDLCSKLKVLLRGWCSPPPDNRYLWPGVSPGTRHEKHTSHLNQHPMRQVGRVRSWPSICLAAMSVYHFVLSTNYSRHTLWMAGHSSKIRSSSTSLCKSQMA